MTRLEDGRYESPLLRDASRGWQARAAISSAVPDGGKGEAVAWQVRRADGRIDGVPIQWEHCTKDFYDATFATGRYAGYENGPQCEVCALYTAPQAEPVKGEVVGDHSYCPSQFGKQPHAFNHQKCGSCGKAAPQAECAPPIAQAKTTSHACDAVRALLSASKEQS